MESRGYKMVSEAANQTWVGFARDKDGIWMSATVYLAQESCTLHGGVLKMMCKLSCEKFDVNSNKFADFENVLYLYAKICSQIDNLVDAEGIVRKAFDSAKLTLTENDGVSEGVNEGVKPDKNTLEARMEKFKKEVIAIGKEKGYPPAMCKKFFNYWSETNVNGKLMRWELQKRKSGVFNTKGRMVTWYGKDQENTFTRDKEERKAKKQNEELKQSPKAINTKELF